MEYGTISVNVALTPGDACSQNADKINKWTAHVNQNKSFISIAKTRGLSVIM